jgi:hypothetical protein
MPMGFLIEYRIVRWLIDFGATVAAMARALVARGVAQGDA